MNLTGGNLTACSYCRSEIETEFHLYVECDITSDFWQRARIWYFDNLGVAPHLVLSGPLLFGLEKEQPQDLFNIFYRSVRYCIFTNRRKKTLPSLNYFVTLVRDELRLKYKGNRILRYADKPEEAKAILWLKVQMGWHLTELNWPRKS